tara:strand:- start:253 stop:666 length:414 start_codon:yes stop_codon:yes gene_type:complete
MKIIVNCVSELSLVVNKLIDFLGNSNIVCFYGEMGVGKTTLIKELCNSLDVKGKISSPTFSIVNEYITNDNKIIYHFDLYRLKNVEELYDIGFEEYINQDNLCLIEWPDKVEKIITDQIIKVYMNRNQEQRIIEIII